MPQRVAKRPPQEVRAWARKFRCAFKARHLRRPADEMVRRLAALVCVVGPPGDKEASGVYKALVALFGYDRRQSRWRPAAEALPPDPAVLHRVAACVQEYRRQVARGRDGPSISSARFRLDEVVKTMVQIPNPEAYVADCVAGGLHHPGAIFHANTLEYARKKFRGAFGRQEGEERAEEREDHLRQIREKIPVVDG